MVQALGVIRELAFLFQGSSGPDRGVVNGLLPTQGFLELLLSISSKEKQLSYNGTNNYGGFRSGLWREVRGILQTPFPLLPSPVLRGSREASRHQTCPRPHTLCLESCSLILSGSFEISSSESRRFSASSNQSTSFFQASWNCRDERNQGTQYPTPCPHTSSGSPAIVISPKCTQMHANPFPNWWAHLIPSPPSPSCWLYSLKLSIGITTSSLLIFLMCPVPVPCF